MLEKAAALTLKYGMLPPGGHVLCAVSGGADSMCLLHWLSIRAGEGAFLLSCAHFDHRLRGEESRRDAAFVENYCRERGIPFYLGAGDVRGKAASAGLGIEETARILRYAFLEKTAEKIGASRIATAHNADDNAETLLLHLIRGTGLQGLSGIPPRRGKLVRPLLTTTREEILEYLREESLSHVDDSTNSDVTYSRNKVRHQVIPLLQEMNPRLLESLSTAAAHLRADNDYLNARAAKAVGEAVWEGETLVIPAGQVGRQADPVAVRAVRMLLVKMGAVQYRSAHLLSVVELARSASPSGRVDLPHGLTARRVYDKLLFTAGSRELPPPFKPEGLNPEGMTRLPEIGWCFTCRRGTAPPGPQPEPDHFYLDPQLLSGDLMVRPRRSGDKITLFKRKKKTVKRLFIDAEIPRGERERIPLLADEKGPVWLGGFGPDAARLARPGGPALEIRAAHLSDTGRTHKQ